MSNSVLFPLMTVVKCDKDKITVPSNGSVECTHQYGNFSYNSSCQYSCEEGYRLSMSRPLTCTASADWSDQPPTCECESKSKNTMFCAVVTNIFKKLFYFVSHNLHNLVQREVHSWNPSAANLWLNWNQSPAVALVVKQALTCRELKPLVFWHWYCSSWKHKKSNSKEFQHGDQGPRICFLCFLRPG